MIYDANYSFIVLNEKLAVFNKQLYGFILSLNKKGDLSFFIFPY